MTLPQRHARFVTACQVVLDHLEQDLAAIPWGTRRYRQLDEVRVGLLRELVAAEAALAG
jgi:hypothetical protein